jgi:biopolymer transport protein ExbD
MAFYKRKRSSPIIPIVSLVDILTVLLIFFIVTTTFKSQTPQVRIELPDSKTAVAAPSAKARPTILTISPDGQCFVNAQPISLEKLGDAIKDAGKDGGEVAMRADKTVPFGTIIKVLDTLKEAGIENLPTQMNDPRK